MTTTLEAPDNSPRAAARFMGNYSRQFAAGAFATPTAREIARLAEQGHWHWWPAGEGGVAAASRRLTRDSLRTDYAGRRYLLPAGSRVITHLAASDAAPLPSLDAFDWVYAYREDRNVTAQLREQGREIYAVRVSAASELIACWGRKFSEYRYAPEDTATLVQLPLDVPPPARRTILEEIADVDTWHDDYPYYSDGSWGAVSLRGFDPADPTWGVKPAEMSKAWSAAHPEAAARTTCDWTVLADRTPRTRELVEQVTATFGELERVRLLRMAGRDGKGGVLARHSDVTDRASGTRDGQIIRFHIPLITHPDITMSAWNLAGRRRDQHLPAWSLWYLDARKPHAVTNRAGIDRIHLVIDVQATREAREAIRIGLDHAA